MAKRSLARSPQAPPRTENAPVAPVSAPNVEPLDRVIHERMRLGIVSALAVAPNLQFNDLKAILNMSDGNLSVHARKLEEAGYITCRKYFEGRSPRTEFALTAVGRKALEHYLGHMEALIKTVRGDG